MAREAGLHKGEFGWTTGDDPNCLYPECVYTKNLKQFEALVRADEREACAALADKLEWADNKGVASAIRARNKT
jgi:hypothetical protein